GEVLSRYAAYYAEAAEAAERHVRGPDQLLWLERRRADVNNLRAAAEWSFGNDQAEVGARLAGALAWFWTLDGRLSEAIHHLERATEASGVSPLVRSKALWGLALLAASLGELERARDATAQSVALARQEDDPEATGYGLNALAVAEWALGNHDAA